MSPPYMDLRCLGMSIIWDDSDPSLSAVGWLLGVGCQGNGAGVECYYSPGARPQWMSARHTLHAAPPFYNFGLTKWRAKLCFPFILEIINLPCISAIINLFHPPVPPVKKGLSLYIVVMPTIASVYGYLMNQEPYILSSFVMDCGFVWVLSSLHSLEIPIIFHLLDWPTVRRLSYHHCRRSKSFTNYQS